jgi:STE24 endopeptidase
VRSLFSDDDIERARDYHLPLYVAWAIGLTMELVLLAALAFSDLGDVLFDPLADLTWWLQTLAIFAIALVITRVATLPLSFWAGYLRERAWGFSTQSARGWVADRAKGLGVAVVLGGTALLGLVALALALPDARPLAAAGAAAAFVVLLVFVAPAILEPLFNRFTPLEDEELGRALRQLATDAGVPIEHVLVADASRRTTKQNAYVSGLGRTRRLVLFDTLLEDSRQPELRLVLAHELGHRRAGHLVKGTVLAASGAAVFILLLWGLLRWPPLLDALDVDGPSDPRIVPFVLLLAACLQLAGAPLGAGISRRWEREADEISLELTPDPQTFETTHRQLALANLADLDPPQLVYLMLFSHPTPPERIAAARAFASLRERELAPARSSSASSPSSSLCSGRMSGESEGPGMGRALHN